MRSYSGEEMEIQELSLKPGERLHVLVMHDECLFYANDGKTSTWCHEKHRY